MKRLPFKSSPAASQKGVSLVEIPVALVVLGIVLIIAARTFMTAGSVQKDSYFTHQAATFAAAKLTELESTPSSLIVDGEDQVQTASGFAFTRKWTVLQPLTGSKAKAVQVEMIWKSNQRNESIRLASLIR